MPTLRTETLRGINIHHGLNPSWDLTFLLANKTFDYNLEKIKLKATKQNTQIAYKKDINILFHMRYIQREKCLEVMMFYI